MALALIANGEIKPSEWARLRDIEAPAQLGLTDGQWHDIVDGLCEDLLATAAGGTCCTVGEAMMRQWLEAVDDADLRTLVIRLSADLILADGRIDPGESALLRVAKDRWGSPGETRMASLGACQDRLCAAAAPAARR